jgi:hypothetical protein
MCNPVSTDFSDFQFVVIPWPDTLAGGSYSEAAFKEAFVWYGQLLLPLELHPPSSAVVY